MNKREEFESKCRERFPRISLKRYDSELVARDFGSEEGDYCAPLARDLWAGFQLGWQAATDNFISQPAAYMVTQSGEFSALSKDRPLISPEDCGEYELLIYPLYKGLLKDQDQ